MTFFQTVGLGALAGLTIFLGLPIARLGRPGAGRMSFLNAASVGVLLFIFWDVISAAVGPIEGALDSKDYLVGTGYGTLLAIGLGFGVLSLLAFEKVFMRKPRPAAATAAMSDGPGALAVGGETAGFTASLNPGQRISLFIAIGIGLHNFSEGLAIGQSSHAGAYELFGLLVIGFGLHNITEGFGITGPLIGQRPSWGFLGLLGLIGGGPTFLGAMLGYSFESVAVAIAFYGLAAGAILYVVGELQHVGRKIGRHDLAMVGLLVGFLAGLGTDMVLHAAGG